MIDRIMSKLGWVPATELRLQSVINRVLKDELQAAQNEKRCLRERLTGIAAMSAEERSERSRKAAATKAARRTAN